MARAAKPIWERAAALLLAVFLLPGCTATVSEETKYTATFLTLFDTVTTVVGRAESQEAFTAKAQDVHDRLLVYHQLFDIYNSYPGLNNLKTVNDQAGIAPVVVDQRIIALLKDCKQYYTMTGGKVNVAMGSVLRLWHEARDAGLDNPEQAALPDLSALKDAAQHVDLECVVIDETASTVFITDSAVQLDVGAVAKGWSAQRVAEESPAGMLLSVGGNVCPTGKPEDRSTQWVVGVNNPDGGSYLHTLNICGDAVVTSGDYQRYYMVDGRLYHHIIDPQTQFPSQYWRSVTIICPDSGLADALSTALFLMPQDAGQALLDACGGEAMWVDAGGVEYFSPGFQEYIRT